MTTTEIDDGLLYDLVQALEFYADPETYYATTVIYDRPCGDIIEDYGNEDEHGHPDYPRPMLGKTARAALTKYYLRDQK